MAERRTASADFCDGKASEYVREPIRRDQDRAHLREALLQGAQAPVTGAIDANYFDTLRAGIRQRGQPAR